MRHGKKAFENRRKVARGETIMGEAKQATVPTIEKALEAVLALHGPTWKHGGKTIQSWRQTFSEYVYPTLDEKRVSEITSKDVHSLVAPLWECETSHGVEGEATGRGRHEMEHDARLQDGQPRRRAWRSVAESR